MSSQHTLVRFARLFAIPAAAYTLACAGALAGQQTPPPNDSARSSVQQAASEQAGKSGAADDKDKRLKELLGKVEVLQKELDSLRKGPDTAAAENAATPAKSEANAAPSNATPESNPASTAQPNTLTPGAGSTSVAFQPEWLKALSWRCIGPAA